MPEFFHRLNNSIRRAFAGLLESLAAFGAALVRPFERAIAATFGRGMHALEGFERIDQWLLGLFWLVTWPVRIVWRLIAAAGALVLPASVFRALGGVVPAYFRFQQGLASAAWGLSEQLNLDGLFRWIAWLTQPLWRPVAAVGGFFIAWLATRPYKQMLWGLPALLLLLPIAGAVAWGVTWGRDSVATQYRVAADRAREQGDYERLRLMQRKLEQLGVDTAGSDYKVALALANEGKVAEAYPLMQKLAPEGAPGYPAAHHWILVRLLGNELPLADEERLRLAGSHLAHLKKLGLKGDDFNLMRAIWLAQSSQLEEAADLLKPLITRFQIAAVQRFEIDLKLKRLDDAREDARALRTHFAEAKRRNATLATQQYMAWAEAERLLGNSADWARVVREWLAIDPENVAARQCVAALDLQEFNDMMRSPQPNADELTDRLVELARLSDNPKALDPQIAQLYHARHETPAIAKMFEALIASPETPMPLVAAIGTSAALEGEVTLARSLLERVVAADDKNAVAWNNLAWSLSQDPDKDVNKALAAVTRALEIAPDEFRFRETRGQIFVSLGRWQEAVDDLEFALNGMPDAAPVHIALATAYEQLGQTELAKIHRQQAQ